MRKLALVALMSALVFPVCAQHTNDVRQGRGEGREWAKTDEERRKKRLDFMDKVMEEIGVTTEQKEEISKVKEEYKQLRIELGEKIRETREKISQLSSENAAPEEIERYIVEYSKLKADELRSMLRNQRKMELILGKEKYHTMMEKARDQYRRRGGSGGGRFGEGNGKGGKPGKGGKGGRRPGAGKGPGHQPENPPV